MGKVALKDKKSKTPKQKRRMRNSSNKYLKPGALAQLRYNKALAAKSCTDLGKKRVAVLDAPETDNSLALEKKGIRGSPSMLSPERFGFSLVAGPFDMINDRNDVLTTPKTPCAEEYECDSRLESLPIDLLVFNVLFPIWLLISCEIKKLMSNKLMCINFSLAIGSLVIPSIMGLLHSLIEFDYTCALVVL